MEVRLFSHALSSLWCNFKNATQRHWAEHLSDKGFQIPTTLTKNFLVSSSVFFIRGDSITKRRVRGPHKIRPVAGWVPLYLQSRQSYINAPAHIEEIKHWI
jgi:hypothetical protein